MPPPATTHTSRPQAVAAQIKGYIVEMGLAPGDRLPSEAEMIRRLGHAKGTVREAFRLLEAQGLIRTRTGPGGGAFVHAVSEGRARALLANYFYFKDLSIADIYQIRALLEPELAASLAGRLGADDLGRLAAAASAADVIPTSAEEERAAHVASLEFHVCLAELGRNPLLGFLVGFLATLLRELTVARHLYEPPNPALFETGGSYQRRLVDALAVGDGAAARAIMADHMATAAELMEAQAELTRRFFEETRSG
jgi:GntR family transcriptional regulator, transcriptional repressor for pyruvate dehydrogenase complex